MNKIDYLLISLCILISVIGISLVISEFNKREFKEFTLTECSIYVGQASQDSYDMGFLRGVHRRGVLSAEDCKILLQKASY